RRQGAAPESRPRAEPDPRSPPPGGDGRGAAGPADANRVALALRARGKPWPDRQHRDAPRPWLGRDRRRRSVVRVGHDAPAPPEGGGGPESPGASPDRA